MPGVNILPCNHKLFPNVFFPNKDLFPYVYSENFKLHALNQHMEIPSWGRVLLLALNSYLFDSHGKLPEKLFPNKIKAKWKYIYK